MFSSLRLKLIAAFAFVTFLTVVLAAVGMMLLLRDREVDAARERVGLLGNIVAEQLVSRAANGFQADSLSGWLEQRAQEVHLRFLLIDGNGEIITDTAGQLTGRSATELTRADREIRRSARGFSFTTWQDQYVFLPARQQIVRQRVTQDYSLLVLVPEVDIAGAWQGLLPRIALSGLIALLAAVAVAYALARSITRPVVNLTRATEAMAQGNYDQRIPVEGRDEIARLARSFNDMAHQVSRTHRAMRDLNANVAHELKTPLTSIQGYSQALLDGLATTPQEVEQAARVINEEADRMRRLVEDLLYLSRLESGQLQLERTTIQVPALLARAAERVEWQVRQGAKELRVQTAIDLPPVQGDERRLEQVLANLLDNAVRHTPPAGRITLSGLWSPDSVTIRVHNTGSYIPPEHLSRIFERFYQAEPSRARDGRQGGLGLAIAREIVAAHGGTLTATSDPAKGTEFTVVLPASLTKPAEGTATAPLRPAAGPAPPVPAASLPATALVAPRSPRRHGRRPGAPPTAESGKLAAVERARSPDSSG